MAKTHSFAVIGPNSAARSWVLVSAVCDILPPGEGAFQPVPDVASAAASHMHGLLMVENRVIGLLRPDQLLPAQGLGGVMP